MTGNESRNVDPANCEKCGGQCCKYYELWYDDSLSELAKSEMHRIQHLEHVGKYVEIIRDNVDRGYRVRFNDRCDYLREDNTCAIHESPDRPLLCRLFPYANSTKQDCPHIKARRRK